MKHFKKVNTEDVRLYWKCPDNDCGCSPIIWINPDWHSDNGTPVCTECDGDMVFDHVEIAS